MDERIIFTDEEKLKLFDDIAKMYFDKNFGETSKADLETLIFSHYIEHCLNNGLKYDDYTLSKELGITQTRIRSLKERKELKYPHKYDWKEAFANLIEHAHYNKDKELIQIAIEDVNLLNEVRHFLVENNMFDEYQLNPKLFQCSIDFFVDLCEKLDAESNISKEIQGIVKELENDEAGIIELFKDGNIKGGLKVLVDNQSDTVADLLNLIPGVKPAAILIRGLMKLLGAV